MFRFASGFVFAQSYGVNLGVSVDNKGQDIDGSKVHENDTEFGASFYYFMDESRELEFGLAYSTEKDEDKDSVEWNVDDDYTQHGITLSGAYNQTMIKGKIAAVGLGVEAGLNIGLKPTGDDAPDYSDYSRYSFGLSLPLKLDVFLSDHLTARLTDNIMNITYYSNSYENLGSKYSVSSTSMETALSNGGARFQLIYKF